MRSFIGVPFVLAAIAAAHSHQHLSTRKSLAFGSSHPHATFKTNPAAQLHQSFAPVTNPFRIAEQYAEQVLKVSRGSESSFAIRDDSYTDSNTGVTHVYLRQIVNGLEVVDGDINLNIHNGRIISFGDSVGFTCFSQLCNY